MIFDESLILFFMKQTVHFHLNLSEKNHFVGILALKMADHQYCTIFSMFF